MKIAIYGTGHVAQRIYNELIEDGLGDCIEFFIDSLVKKDEFLGKKVVSLSYLETLDVNSYQYYLGSLGSQNSMKMELLSRGVNIDNIIINHDYSEDNFENSVNNISSVLLYPPASEKEQKRIIEMIKYYMGKAYYYIKFEFAKEDSDITQNVDLVLVWDKNALRNTRKRTDGKVFCIDKTFYDYIDIRILGRLANKIYKEKGIDKYNKDSVDIFSLLKEKYTRAYVFGNGPSLAEGIEKCIEDNNKSLKIVCNGIISNGEKELEVLNPQIYAFVDSAYLEKNYCKFVLDAAVEYVLKHDTYFLVPQFWIAIMLHWYPDLEGKIIGLELAAPGIQFPSESSMKVYRKAGNVITNMAIPFASALVEEIRISGCDGAKKIISDEILWEHSNIAEENIIVNTNMNIDYLAQHNQYFGELLNYGEQQGKRYYSITESYIPCLKERNI